MGLLYLYFGNVLFSRSGYYGSLVYGNTVLNIWVLSKLEAGA